MLAKQSKGVGGIGIPQPVRQVLQRAEHLLKDLSSVFIQPLDRGAQLHYDLIADDGFVFVLRRTFEIAHEFEKESDGFTTTGRMSVKSCRLA
jgi:hypothetical protein